MQVMTPARIAAAAALGASVPLAAASGLAAHRPMADPPTAAPAQQRQAAGERYAVAVAKICSGALLFEHAHAIGTDAGARAAAQDIRQSARRRLDRVAVIPIPRDLRRPATRWISLQRRLAESYATNWMRIHYAIDAARTPPQRARLPRRLAILLHAPDPLRRTSRRLELALGVPDCTGGDPDREMGGAAQDRASVRQQPEGPVSG
jgi:hypothetical protein